MILLNGKIITSQKEKIFSLILKYNNLNIKEYKIFINNDGVLNKFSIIEDAGKCINYYLFYQDYHLIDKKFDFVLSKNMPLDEQ